MSNPEQIGQEDRGNDYYNPTAWKRAGTIKKPPKRRQVGHGEPIDYDNLPKRKPFDAKDYFDHVGISVKSVLDAADHPNDEFADLNSQYYGEAILNKEDLATLMFAREMRERWKEGLHFLSQHPRIRHSRGIRQK